MGCGAGCQSVEVGCRGGKRKLQPGPGVEDQVAGGTKAVPLWLLRAVPGAAQLEALTRRRKSRLRAGGVQAPGRKHHAACLQAPGPPPPSRLMHSTEESVAHPARGHCCCCRRGPGRAKGRGGGCCWPRSRAHRRQLRACMLPGGRSERARPQACAASLPLLILLLEGTQVPQRLGTLAVAVALCRARGQDAIAVGGDRLGRRSHLVAASTSGSEGSVQAGGIRLHCHHGRGQNRSTPDIP